MKNIFIIISLVFVVNNINAQNKNTAKADKLYKQFEYIAAAKAYLALNEKEMADGYVYKQIGDCYYNMFNTLESEKFYSKAIAVNKDPETNYRYSQMLKANGKYDEANKQMQQFANKMPNDDRSKTFLTNQDYLPKLNSQSKSFEVKKLELNSEQSEFSPVLNNGNLYFVSSRNVSRKKGGFDGQAFLDIYQSSQNIDGTFAKPEAIVELNTKWHDGPVSITADGNTMYFNRDSHNTNSYELDKKLKTKFGQMSLVKATKTNGKWGNEVLLPFNSKSYSVSSPSISKDGKTLYFSSDMPGSKGDADIWKVTVDGDTYGTPVNLGDKVNTAGKENFPFITDDNILFFASSGKQGFGGLDVYEIDLNKGTDAINVGKPVNSEKDDFSFSFNNLKNSGFFASNRDGNDDIFGATPVCYLDIQTVVTDSKTGNTLSDAKVTILDDKNKIIYSGMSNDSGVLKYKVDCEKNYTIAVEKTGYDNNSFTVVKVSKAAQTTVDAKITPTTVIITEKEIILSPIYFEYNKSNITEQGAFELDKLVEVLKSKPELVIFAKSHTDNRGKDEFNLALSDRRAQSTVQYIVSKGIDATRITGKGMGKTEPKIDCKESCTEEEHAQNRRSEFLIVK
jgi:outer membrane protein OmpA-like peptidoglycan-associated protein